MHLCNWDSFIQTWFGCLLPDVQYNENQTREVILSLQWLYKLAHFLFSNSWTHTFKPGATKQDSYLFPTPWSYSLSFLPYFSVHNSINPIMYLFIFTEINWALAGMNTEEISISNKFLKIGRSTLRDSDAQCLGNTSAMFTAALENPSTFAWADYRHSF